MALSDQQLQTLAATPCSARKAGILRGRRAAARAGRGPAAQFRAGAASAWQTRLKLGRFAEAREPLETRPQSSLPKESRAQINYARLSLRFGEHEASLWRSIVRPG
jgi:hypothetical protein